MAGTSFVAGDVVVDALPYFDQGYDAPGVREAVSAVYGCRGSSVPPLGKRYSDITYTWGCPCVMTGTSRMSGQAVHSSVHTVQEWGEFV